MDDGNRPRRAVINQEQLPPRFPTHRHKPAFWEHLGRTIATFSFLEEVLGKAIFAFTATRRYDESEIDEAYRRWLPQLQSALSDTLYPLAEVYEKTVRDHPDAVIENFSVLVENIKIASKKRSVLCHGSWRSPNSGGASVPLFFNKKNEKFVIPIDTAYLEQLQQEVVQLACEVINSVTSMGWQFPGGAGPGEPIT
jgi:hypothetical protein